MSEEHVIPRSIGGDNRTVIMVCKVCNDTMGHSLDTKLSKDGWFKLNALLLGKPPTHQDRIKTTTKLKGGRTLEGVQHFIKKDNGYLPSFIPNRVQSDDSIWVSEDSIKKGQKLPEEINILKRDMVEYWGYYCLPPKNRGIEPSIIKIVIGFIYLDLGRKVISKKEFSILRFCLKGRMHENIEFSWLDSPMQWGNSKVKNNEHAVYYECEEGKDFKAGVSIFGTGIVFNIKNFGRVLPKRCCKWDARPNCTNVEMG